MFLWVRSWFGKEDKSSAPHYRKAHQQASQMIDWRQDLDILVNEVEIRYEDELFHARGFLKWSPKIGFQLIGSIYDRTGSRRPIMTPGRTRSLPKDHYCRILLKPKGYLSATPRKAWFYHEPMFPIPVFSDIDFSFGGLTFIQEWEPRKSGERHQSKTVFRVTPKLHLPDRLEQKVSLDGDTVQETYSAKGLAFKTDSLTLRSWINQQGDLECYASLLKSKWKDYQAWRVPKALETALALCCGEHPVLFQSERNKCNRRFQEVWKEDEVVKFSVLSPIKVDPVIDKDVFLHLFQSLIKDHDVLNLAHQLCLQLREAMKQDSGAAMELLFATCLEGFLRTLSGNPFHENKKKLSLQNELGKFGKKFRLPDEWKAISDEGIAAHDRIRHRNAHPDWLMSRDGYLSEERLTQTTDDLIKLARLYGFMVLAVTGFKELPTLIQKSLNGEFKKNESATCKSATSTQRVTFQTDDHLESRASDAEGEVR